MKRIFKINKIKQILFGYRTILLFLTAPLLIGASASASSLSISDSYPTNSTIQSGYIVSLNSSQQAELANVNNSNNLLGVVISKNSSNISYNSSATSAQVGTSGSYYVDVSTINGDINTGDRISASIIDGIGQKATKPSRVLGIAEANFNKNSTTATKQDINSQIKNIYVGQIPVSISVSDFAGIPQPIKTNSLVLKFQSFASKVANKNVSENNALIGLIIFSIGLILAVVMLIFSLTIAVRSIGRNPLAKKGIFRYILLIIVMVIVIITLSTGAAYIVISG